MCGIAGLVKITSAEIPAQRSPRVLERLRHRGPDDGGWLKWSSSPPSPLAANDRGQRTGQVQMGRVWCDGPPPDVVLLHRRLSILELSEAGAQPMRSADGRLFVTFNGEIYNYIELAEELRRLGHSFHSNSDTEVLLAAFSEWGIGALRRFVGMFALALLDVERGTVLLARDFFGIKPLYYATNGAFAFASEVKAVMEFASTARRVDADLVYRFLRFGVSDDNSRTLFSEIAQLPPGHYLKVAVNGGAPGPPMPYWTPEVTDRRDLSRAEAAATVRDLFLESVRLHLRSDVPVGAALSGGIDSSSIVMAMRHLEPTLEINTFSFIADDAEISEERWVDIVGANARARVHKIRATAAELVSDLDALNSVQDEPLASTSPYAQYRVFERARQAGIKVMLDGQGADEMLAGYRYYLAARLASLVRQGRFTEARQFVARAARANALPRSWLLMKAAAYLLPAAWQSLPRRLVGQNLMPPWLDRRWFQSHGVAVQPVHPPAAGLGVLRGALLQELTATSLPVLLRYEDRNSMAFSIESRVPFLTPKLVNYILSLPEEYIISDDGTSKAVFRQAMRGLVPDAILDRRDKIGFQTPERHWLGAVRPWVEKTLRSDAAATIPVFNQARLIEEWQQVITERRSFNTHLWRALNLIKWTEQFAVRYG